MIGLTTGLILFLGTLQNSANSTASFSKAIQSDMGTSIEKSVQLRSSAYIEAGQSVEARVRAYFSDMPILAEVSRCESTFMHFDKQGKIVRGIVNHDDIGVMQINEFYHKDTAKALGIDLYTLEGNMAYAKWLYKREGTAPWSASSKCWSKSAVVASNQ